MYELAVMPEPPLRVVIGSDAYSVCIPLFRARIYVKLTHAQGVMKKIDEYGTNYKKYEKIANSTDVDE